MQRKILIIEDEQMLRHSLKKIIEIKRNYMVDEAESFKTAVKKIRDNEYDIYLTDMMLPDGTGLELLKKFRSRMEEKTIVVTAHASISDSVEAIKNGAFYYLEKPLEEDLLFIQMDKILEIRKLKEKNIAITNELIPRRESEQPVYKSAEMAEVISMALKFARTDNTVLIQGNTGVGKEIIAKFIHSNSKRKDKTYLPINCSSIPEQLFESELFGFKKGAFTGASENYNGRFVQADKGTLFLDEIGEMPYALQSKLLRVLEDETIYQLGNNHPIKIDVRLIAATNRDLWQDVQDGKFRKDLYFRLKATRIYIPPLSERKDDILLLVRHYISLYNTIFDRNIDHITSEAEAFLLDHPWEGNVRELKNTIKSIFTLNETNTITVKDLMFSLHEKDYDSKPAAKKNIIPLDEFEQNYVAEVFNANNRNIRKTARVLHISRNRLYRILKDLKMTGDEEPPHEG